jgi:hypothetical protein
MKKQIKIQSKKQVNWKIVIFSLIALSFVALGFLVNGYFILGAVVFMLLNQREMMNKRKK